MPGVRVVTEPRKGLVRARERGRLSTGADLLLFLDADCRAPLQWIERVERRFVRHPRLLALSAGYRFYDWHWFGRTLIRGYDFTVGPATHLLVKRLLNAGVVFYGGNFAVRASALAAIGGFDVAIEFHGEDTNLGRRLHAAGPVELRGECYVHTSARRYRAMGTGAVISLYVRNFWSEILRHRPERYRPPGRRAKGFCPKFAWPSFGRYPSVTSLPDTRPSDHGPHPTARPIPADEPDAAGR